MAARYKLNRINSIPSSHPVLLQKLKEATTQLKQVAFHQPITQYQILCCYRVSRAGLLNEQRLRELVQVRKAQADDYI